MLRSKRKFPSPCGEKVGINCSVYLGNNYQTDVIVSVPLRGKGRDQLLKNIPVLWLNVPRFRPLAGKR